MFKKITSTIGLLVFIAAVVIAVKAYSEPVTIWVDCTTKEGAIEFIEEAPEDWGTAELPSGCQWVQMNVTDLERLDLIWSPALDREMQVGTYTRPDGTRGYSAGSPKGMS